MNGRKIMNAVGHVLAVLSILLVVLAMYGIPIGGDAPFGLAIVNVALVDARKRLDEKQKALAQVFEEAGPTVDYSNVKCLGSGLTTIAVAEKVRSMNAELNEIGTECETLAAADEGLKTLDRLGKLKQPPADPEMKGRDRRVEEKSIGERTIESEKFQEHFIKNKRTGGIDLDFPDMYPSEMLSKGTQFKTLMTTAAGWAPESTRVPGLVIPAVTRPIQLLDIIPMDRTSMAAVVYMEETTRTHSAAEKAEGVAYAESAFVLTQRSSTVQKITDSLPITDEQLEDEPMVNGYVNNRLTFGLRQRLDGQVLVGDGSSPNLRGIKNVSGIQTQAKGSDPTMDAFFKAMVKVRVTGRAVPTHHVIHPTDWQTLRLARTADGIYILGNPTDTSIDRLWGLPVVQSDADSAGTGYVGSFDPQWLSLFERQGIQIAVGYVGTQFTEGKRTIRGDVRFAFVVFRAAAFCSVTGL